MFYEKIDFICLYYCLFIVLERFNLNFLICLFIVWAKYGNRDFEIVIVVFFATFQVWPCTRRDCWRYWTVGDIEWTANGSMYMCSEFLKVHLDQSFIAEDVHMIWLFAVLQIFMVIIN